MVQDWIHIQPSSVACTELMSFVFIFAGECVCADLRYSMYVAISRHLWKFLRTFQEPVSFTMVRVRILQMLVSAAF